MFSSSLPLVVVIPSRQRLIPCKTLRGLFRSTSGDAAANRATKSFGSSLMEQCSSSSGTRHSTPDFGNRVLSPIRRIPSLSSISSTLFRYPRTASRNSSNPTIQRNSTSPAHAVRNVICSAGERVLKQTLPSLHSTSRDLCSGIGDIRLISFPSAINALSNSFLFTSIFIHNLRDVENNKPLRSRKTGRAVDKVQTDLFSLLSRGYIYVKLE